MSDEDGPVWDEAKLLAENRGVSLSKFLTAELRRAVREQRGATGVPLGVKVPASMKDPRLVRAEVVADQLREQVIEALMSGPET